MPAIGITGGISTGKSTFCECLREILPAAKFFDADAVARHLVDLEEVKQELLAKFGFGIFSRNGALKRTGTAHLPNFSSQTFHFSMKPVVKPCATAWWWSPVRPISSSPIL